MEDNRIKMYSKVDENYHISNKKALFWNMSQYYKTVGQEPFKVLPLTFHVETGLNDPEFFKFQRRYREEEIRMK